MVVVLPAPLGPRKPSTSPGRASKLTPSSATAPAYRLARSTARITLSSYRRSGWVASGGRRWSRRASARLVSARAIKYGSATKTAA